MQEMKVMWVLSRAGKMLWSRKWQLTPVFSPGKFHGQRSLAGYSPWGRKESDMTEHTHIGLHKASNTNGYIGGKVMLLVSEPQTLSWSILSCWKQTESDSLYAQSDYGDQISMTIHSSIYWSNIYWTPLRCLALSYALGTQRWIKQDPLTQRSLWEKTATYVSYNIVL